MVARLKSYQTVSKSPNCLNEAEELIKIFVAVSVPPNETVYEEPSAIRRSAFGVRCSAFSSCDMSHEISDHQKSVREIIPSPRGLHTFGEFIGWIRKTFAPG
jgi:hypothetical protein